MKTRSFWLFRFFRDFWDGCCAGVDMYNNDNGEARHGAMKQFTATLYLAFAAFFIGFASCDFWSDSARAGLPLAGLLLACILPRSDCRPVPRLELVLTLGILVPLVIIIYVCDLVGPGHFSDVTGHIVCQPAFIIPFCLIMLWAAYRRWQRDRTS